MSTRIWWSIIVVLLIVIAVLAWLLFATPAHAPTIEVPVSTSTVSTSTTTTGTQPLHARVTVTSPAAHATVGHTLVVAGEAPGPWYFEASFPIKVVDKDGNVLGQGPAQAQRDWMIDQLVPFTATITLDPLYHGPATLALLKDNPSGLPENDDSLEVPIVIQ